MTAPTLAERAWTAATVACLVLAVAVVALGLGVVAPLVAALVLAFAVGGAVDRLFVPVVLRRVREVAEWHEEEIHGRKLADWRDDVNYVRLSGETPAVDADTVIGDDLDPPAYVAPRGAS